MLSQGLVERFLLKFLNPLESELTRLEIFGENIYKSKHAQVKLHSNLGDTIPRIIERIF